MVAYRRLSSGGGVYAPPKVAKALACAAAVLLSSFLLLGAKGGVRAPGRHLCVAAQNRDLQDAFDPHCALPGARIHKG